MAPENPSPPTSLSWANDVSVGVEKSNRVGSDTDLGQAIGVVVLGMGRSGTSSVARMFAKAGFFVGAEDDLMPATDANPTGHWENLRIWRINERLLDQLGASWFDPPSAEEQMVARRTATPLLQVEIDRLVDEAEGRPIALKDPRIGVMLTLWKPILRGRLHPIVVVRDPCEIARSLQRRDGTPIPFALSAWETHMTLLLGELVGESAMVLPYARVIEDEQMCFGSVQSVIGRLHPALREEVHPERGFDAFQPTLRRNRVSAAEHVENLTGRQTELWRYLSSLTPDNQRLDPPENLLRPSAAALAGVSSETDRLRKDATTAQLRSELNTKRICSARLSMELEAERRRNEKLSTEVEIERDRRT